MEDKLTNLLFLARANFHVSVAATQNPVRALTIDPRRVTKQEVCRLGHHVFTSSYGPLLWRVAVALDHLADGGGEVAAGGVEVRVDLERAAEEVGGFLVLAEGEMAEALAAERA